jgi:hypothetical protein
MVKAQPVSTSATARLAGKSNDSPRNFVAGVNPGCTGTGVFATIPVELGNVQVHLGFGQPPLWQ